MLDRGRPRPEPSSDPACAGTRTFEGEGSWGERSPHARLLSWPLGLVPPLHPLILPCSAPGLPGRPSCPARALSLEPIVCSKRPARDGAPADGDQVFEIGM